MARAPVIPTWINWQRLKDEYECQDSGVRVYRARGYGTAGFNVYLGPMFSEAKAIFFIRRTPPGFTVYEVQRPWKLASEELFRRYPRRFRKLHAALESAAQTVLKVDALLRLGAGH